MIQDALSPARKALAANAIFSGTNGLTALLAAAPLAEWMGVAEPMILRALGGGLLLFAGLLIYLQQKPTLKPLHVRLIVLADALWVVGSLILLFLPVEGLSTGGIAIIGSTALIVLALATWQELGVRRSERT